MALKLRRGVNADRTGITPAQGEPIYTTDTKKLYIGDGTTAGGVEIGGGGTLTVNTQDFTASGTWTKPANAIWVEVTMCGAGQGGQAGATGYSGGGGSAGRAAQKTFLAADLASTVSVTCGTSQAWGTGSDSAQSSFGTLLYASGPGRGPNDEGGGSSIEIMENSSAYDCMYGTGSGDDLGRTAGSHGSSFQGGGGGRGGDSAGLGQAAGFAGGKAASNRTANGSAVATGDGGAGGASGTTGVAGTAGGYDTVTGFGNGGGGGGQGTSGAGGAGGAAVRGGGGGGGGKGTTAGGAGGAGGAGFVRVRTLCFG